MNRIKEIDIMKGIAVLNVIAIHLWSSAVNSFESVIGFTLAGFFLVSGYFLKYKPNEKELIRRLRQILRPFLKYYLVIIISCGAILMLKGESTWMEFLRASVSELLGKEFLDIIAPGFYLKNALHRPLTVTWFFVQLCLSTTISVLILNFCKGKLEKVKVAIVLCLLLSMEGYYLFGSMPLQIQMTFSETAFMLIGYCAKEGGLLKKMTGISSAKKVLMITVGFCAEYIINLWNPGISFMSHGTMGSKGALDVLTATCAVLIGSVSLYLLCGYLGRIKIVEKILTYVGRNSLDYVMLHMLIAWMAYRIFSIPIPMDYVKQASYHGDIFNDSWMFGIFILNLGVCTLWILLKKRIAKNP